DEAGNEQNDIWSIDADGNVESVVELPGQTILRDVDGDRLILGGTHEGQMNLYDHDRSTGETTKLTDYDRAVMGGKLSPDGDKLVYATNESEDFDNVDVYVADADGSNPRNLQIGETGAEATPSDWHPDGDRILVSD
ncbi:MAG: TolB family protein, partial [Halobacteriaceae archaeon]